MAQPPATGNSDFITEHLERMVDSVDPTRLNTGPRDYSDTPAIRLKNIVERANIASTAPQYLVEGWIPKGAVTNLAGHGESGKTYSTLELMVASLLGKPWLRLETTEINTACFITAENSEAQVEWRLDGILKRYQFGTQNGRTPRDEFADWLAERGKQFFLISTKFETPRPFWEWRWIEGTEVPGPTDLWLDLRWQLQDVSADLVIIDSITHYYWGGVIDKGKVLFVHSELQRFAETCQCSVIYLFHPTMSGLKEDEGELEGMGGAMDWHNQADARLYIKYSRESGERILRQKKGRDSAKQKDIYLEWASPGFRVAEQRDQHLDHVEQLVMIANKEKTLLSPKKGTAYYPGVMYQHHFNRDADGKRIIRRKTEAHSKEAFEQYVSIALKKGTLAWGTAKNSSRQWKPGLICTPNSMHYEHTENVQHEGEDYA